MSLYHGTQVGVTDIHPSEREHFRKIASRNERFLETLRSMGTDLDTLTDKAPIIPLYGTHGQLQDMDYLCRSQPEPKNSPSPLTHPFRKYISKVAAVLTLFFSLALNSNEKTLEEKIIYNSIYQSFQSQYSGLPESELSSQVSMHVHQYQDQ